MTFKKDWEKTEEHINIPSPSYIDQMVAIAFPEKKLISYTLISGGCANLNFKINLENDEEYVLRIYIRDKNAAYLEQNITDLVKETLPVPEVYFVGNYKDYRFAIIKYIKGITLRELLLNYPLKEWENVMVEVGKILSSFQKFKFPKSGEFNKNLEIKEELFNIKEFVFECLKNKEVTKCLEKEDIVAIKQILNNYNDLLKNFSPYLVHGDFDPSNILVDKINDKWYVSGILDWEFAHSDNWLMDVANMLRYAHYMPDTFQKSFIKGIEEQGIKLPENWYVIASIYNIASILDIMATKPLDDTPKICKDVCELIKDIVLKLS
ncbi:MAG: aminoglycoside phosphotransferase family protein [Sphingobacteriia bacterium]|nr:aminoglycoside phosphotransferase family protein [Sphingobacteriia bacterium]